MSAKYESKLAQYLIGHAENAIDYLQFYIKDAASNKNADFARSLIYSYIFNGKLM